MKLTSTKPASTVEISLRYAPLREAVAQYQGLSVRLEQLIISELRSFVLKNFNQTPKVSFSPALPVGVESEIEFFEMDLAEPIRRPAEMLDELNRQLPSSMAITALALAKKKAPVNEIISYDCLLPEGVDLEQTADCIAAFQVTEKFLLERSRKGKSREFDLKEFIKKLELGDDGRLLLDLYHPCAEAGIGPRDTLAAVFGLKEEQAELVRIVKLRAREV